LDLPEKYLKPLTKLLRFLEESRRNIPTSLDPRLQFSLQRPSTKVNNCNGTQALDNQVTQTSVETVEKVALFEFLSAIDNFLTTPFRSPNSLDFYVKKIVQVIDKFKSLHPIYFFEKIPSAMVRSKSIKTNNLN
jgi:hypothetical protein